MASMVRSTTKRDGRRERVSFHETVFSQSTLQWRHLAALRYAQFGELLRTGTDLRRLQMFTM
jgi:hypothetical protein